MVAQVLIKRTSTPNQPPAANSLQPGELAVEMATQPQRLWIGVPTSIDASGRVPLNAPVWVSETAPTPTQGYLWYESDTGILWMAYNDGTSMQWVQVNGVAAGSGGIADAPNDGVQYGRQSAAWTPVVATAVDAYTKAETDAKQAQDQLDFVNVTGDTMTGPLRITDVTANALVTDGGASFGSAVRQVSINDGQLAITDTGGGNQLILYNDGSTVNSYIDARNISTGAASYLGIRASTMDLQCSGGLCSVSGVNAGVNLQVVAAGGGQPQVMWNRDTVVHNSMGQSGTRLHLTSNNASSAGVALNNNENAWTVLSDARLPYKQTATPVNDILSRLANFQLYTSIVPSHGKPELFTKAQELQVSFPELVSEPPGADARTASYVPTGITDPNAWGVTYDRAGVVALQAIKELLARVEALETQLNPASRAAAPQRK